MARKLKQARWSYAEDRRLLDLAKSSKSPEATAAVYRMAIRFGVPLRPIELGLKVKTKP